MPGNNGRLSATASLDLERAVDRFEDAWQHGERPAIEAYLPVSGDRSAALVELVHVDLERRLKTGEPVRVEEYLRQYPELEQPAIVLDLLRAEYRLRRRHDRSLTVHEYGGRFPQYRHELTVLFELLPATIFVPPGTDPSTTDTVQTGPLPDGAIALTSRYDVVRRHARGGLGEILVARDAVLHREVALKRLQPEQAHADSRHRFLREAEITSQLEHPGVVPVYGFGQLDGQSPVYAMRFIRGETFLEAIQRFHAADASGRDSGARRLALQQLLQRFLSVCNTVGYAHSRGVLHRDLKPSNILLGEYGETLVVDWGLAKRIGVRGQGSGVRGQETGELSKPADSCPLTPDSWDSTQAGTVIGTPAYMAPEQAAGDAERVGPAADVYSLGATLYTLLTGQPPFQDTRIEDVLVRVQRGDFLPPRARHRLVPPALEAICLKAMARRPKDRYPTALDLAADLQNWLAGEPVGAWAEPLTVKGRRWLERHPTLATVTLVAVVGAALLAAVVDHEHSERRLADLRAESARKDTETTQKELERVDRDSYLYRIGRAGRDWLMNQRRQADRLLDQCRPDLRQWEWYHLKRCCRADEQILRGHTSEVWAVAFSPHGRRLASASLDHTVRVWELATGKLLFTLRHAGPVWAVAFSPDGRFLATGSDDQTVRLHDGTTGALLRVLQHGAGEVLGCCFSPDGRRLAVATAPGRSSRNGPIQPGAVRVWDVASGTEVLTLHGHTAGVHGIAFSLNGKYLASCGFDQSVRLWEAHTGQELHTFQVAGRNFYQVAFSPDCRLLASASSDGTVRLWDLPSGKLQHTLIGHTNHVWGVAFSPDGKRLASSSDDTTIKVWDVALGRLLFSLRGHTRGIANVAFSPDGKRLASASDDQTVRIWDAAGCAWARTLCADANRASDVAFSPDGKQVATAGDEHGIKVWNVATGRLLRTLPCPAGSAAVAFSPDGQRLAAAGDDRVVHLWDVATGREEGVLHGHTDSIGAIAFSPDGRLLASASADRTVRLWDLATGNTVFALNPLPAPVWGLAFSPDGHRLATAGGDKAVRLWDAATGQLLRTLAGHSSPVRSVAFSPDGRTLAVASAATERVLTSEPGEIKLWDLETGEERLTLQGHLGDILRVTFSPDGKRLASGGSDGTVKIWDAASGQSLLTLYGHVDAVTSVAFSPDGRLVASASGDGNVILWDGRLL